MALLIDTTDADGESEPWPSAGPFLLQAEVAEDSRTRVELLIRTDDAAPWVSVGSARPAAVDGALLHWPLALAVTAKVAFYSNEPGSAVKIWRVS